MSFAQRGSDEIDSRLPEEEGDPLKTPGVHRAYTEQDVGKVCTCHDLVAFRARLARIEENPDAEDEVTLLRAAIESGERRFPHMRR